MYGIDNNIPKMSGGGSADYYDYRNYPSIYYRWSSLKLGSKETEIMKNHLDSDPYAEGADARLAGKDESANPYEIATDAHLSWNDGWASIDNDTEDESE